MFEGGCCAKTDFIKGSVYNLSEDFQAMARIQDEGAFLCNAGSTIGWIEKNNGSSSIYDYYEHMWGQGLREWFLNGQDGPKDFSQWANEVNTSADSPWAGPSSYWKDTVFTSICLEDRIGGGGGKEEETEGW